MIFCIPGTHPALSLAELHVLLEAPVDIASATAEIVLIKSAGNPRHIQKRAGSLVKTGRIIGAFETYDQDAIVAFLRDYVPAQTIGKVQFGVSVYDAGNEPLAHDLRSSYEQIGMRVKHDVKSGGRSVRYVTSKGTTMSSVVVETNNIIGSGGEYALVATTDGVLIGQTETVQDFKGWSKRDYGRPGRDPASGMLPPKLARIMCNLANAPADAVVLDPFCGSGTVLMEAGLLGHKHILGSDISPKAVEDARKNLHWLKEKQLFSTDVTICEDMDTSRDEPFVCVAEAAAEALHAHLSPETIDVIVTEPYLGPPQTGNESDNAIARIKSELNKLYKTTFSALFPLLKPGGTCVVSFPVFFRATSAEHLPLRDMMENIGFETVDPLPASTPTSLRTVTQNGGLLYKRPGQRVAREILVYKKP